MTTHLSSARGSTSQAVLDLLAAAARDLAEDPTAQETFDHIVHLAVDVVPGCSAAGISLVSKGQVSTAAATDDGVRIGDQMQYDLGEGPCLDAIGIQEVVRSGDIAGDTRWPRWAPAAAKALGIRSMLSFQLYTSETKHGALNLYSTDLDAFSSADEPVVAMFAAIAAAAMTSAQTEEQLHSAVASRMAIGQAQGIIMERFALSASNAFSVMNRISQDTNTRLVGIAEQIVSTRIVPGTGQQPPS